MPRGTPTADQPIREALDQVIRCTLAAPLWEQTAVLHGMMVVLRQVLDGHCEFADETDQIRRMRQHVERLLEREPLVRLHQALIAAERRLEQCRAEAGVAVDR